MNIISIPEAYCTWFRDSVGNDFTRRGVICAVGNPILFYISRCFQQFDRLGRHPRKTSNFIGIRRFYAGQMGNDFDVSTLNKKSMMTRYGRKLPFLSDAGALTISLPVSLNQISTLLGFLMGMG